MLSGEVDSRLRGNDNRLFMGALPMKKQTQLLILITIALLGLIGCQSGEAEPQILRVATTTSTVDSGLMDVILPAFEAEYDTTVELIAVGTGQALAMGEAGDVDIVLVHARNLEDEFVAAGHGVDRRDVMYNDFVILGPADDPAGIMGMESAAAAMAQLAASEAAFVSRGDNSGTHNRELALWAAANIEPSGDWYQSVGQGMGASLTIADEQPAYIIADRGTFIKREADGLGLVVLVEGDGLLANEYGIIAVNPAVHEGVNYDSALEFINWFVTDDTQEAIEAYKLEGQQLFYGNAE